MPVKPDSRYATLPLLSVAAPDGSTRNVIGLRLQRKVTNVQTTAYRVRDADYPDAIARSLFGDEHLWWRILDVNDLVFPLDIKAGDTLDLPKPGPATAITRARRF